MKQAEEPQVPDDGTVHALLYKWIAEIIDGLTKKGEKLRAEDVALKLYHKVRKTTHKWRMQMLEILAQDGAHQFAMKVLRRWGPNREATPKQTEKAAEEKENETEQQGETLFQWGDIKLPPDEDKIVAELDKYGLRQVRTKTEYVLIVLATPEQLREAVALRAAQIHTMQTENDLLERLAQLRETRRGDQI